MVHCRAKLKCSGDTKSSYDLGKQIGENNIDESKIYYGWLRRDVTS
jgi:hypothetical protein